MSYKATAIPKFEKGLRKLAGKYTSSPNLLLLWLTLTLNFLCVETSAYGQATTAQLLQIIDTTFAAHPATTGISVIVISKDGKTWSYATGVSDKNSKARLKTGQPMLVASNTKTYVAAAILRLQEMKKLDIADTIGKYLTPRTLAKLKSKGYETGKITIRHLLSHTSGIEDYVDEGYFDFVNTHRKYKWTRDEQIDRAMKIGKPLAAPGDTFKYADVNYLLLTEMIEQITHKPYCTAVRTLDRFKELGLNATWFIDLEPKPKHVPALAHQYWNKYPWDSYDLDPSWDLYGGGGVATTPGDLALFFKCLFEGKIIRDTQVLRQMYADLPYRSQTNYHLGLRKLRLAGLTAYYHGGFWGTDVAYFPELKTAICIAVLEKSERDVSAGICTAIAEEIKQSEHSK